MEIFYQIMAILAAGLLVGVLYRYIKSKPEELSRENLSKSFSTLGVLALLLIGFVTLLVYIVRST